MRSIAKFKRHTDKKHSIFFLSLSLSFLKQKDLLFELNAEISLMLVCVCARVDVKCLNRGNFGNEHENSIVRKKKIRIVDDQVKECEMMKGENKKVTRTTQLNIKYVWSWRLKRQCFVIHMIDLWPEESIEDTFGFRFFSISLFLARPNARMSNTVNIKFMMMMMMMMKFARNTNSILASDLNILGRLKIELFAICSVEIRFPHECGWQSIACRSHYIPV